MFSGVNGLWMLFAALVAGYYLVVMIYPAMFMFLGLDHNQGWFLDSFAILAANDAQAAGFNPWLPHPFDPMGRPHVYSHWWLRLGDFGLTRDHNYLFGGTMAGLFFIAVLAWLRPRSFGQLGWYLVVVCSAPVVLAVERGNNDLLMFSLLISVVPMMLSERAWVRWCAMVPVLLATGLKFYPALAGLVLLAGTQRREAWLRSLVCAAGLVLLLWTLRHDLALLRGKIPNPYGVMSFGAGQAFILCGVEESRSGLWGIALGGVLTAVCRPWRWLAGWMPYFADREVVMAVLGAVLLTGCFFLGSSYTYRFIYCLMMLPLLWRMMRGEVGDQASRRFAFWTAGLMIVMLWSDSLLVYQVTKLVGKHPDQYIIELADRIVLWRQPLVWGGVVCMLGLVLRFVIELARDFWGREVVGRRV